MKAILPNNIPIKSTHIAKLKNTSLIPKAQVCYLFPELQEKILISLEQLYNNGMKIILNKFQLLVVSNNEEERLILKGIRSSINGM